MEKAAHVNHKYLVNSAALEAAYFLGCNASNSFSPVTPN
jgi:hypothetical protein